MNLVKRAMQQVGAGLSLADLDRMMDAAFGGSPSYTGKLVSQTTSLAVGAVWASVSALSDDLATLPLLTYRQVENAQDDSKPIQEPGTSGRTLAKDHYLWGLLQDEANPEMTAFRFKQLMMAWVLLWGNAYAEIEISGRGQVTALWPWRPDRVRVSRQASASGPLQYTYTTQDQKKFTVPHDRIFHLRGLGVDGVMGLSPIEVHKQTIGAWLATQEHGARFFSNGARPLGLLSHPSKLGDVAYKRLQDNWAGQHQGLDNAHRVAILEEGLTWKEAGINMVDAQYIESLKLSSEDIARIYGVPAHRIGLLDRATNNNVEELALEYIQYSLGHWAENWKQEVAFSLLSARERQSISVGFNFRNLLRGDHESMGKFINVLVQNGIANSDEIRDEFLDWNPQPDGLGKTYYKPVNMAPEGEEREDKQLNPKTPPPSSKPNGKVNGLATQ